MPGLARQEERLGKIIGAVARQALADREMKQVALLDDGSPEAGLALRLLQRELAPDQVVRITIEARQVELLLQILPAGQYGERSDEEGERRAAELRRLHSRLLPDALTASPENKTSLLLGGALPPEPLLPLGDLYASEVAELAGGWSVPRAVREIVEIAGGIERLDGALRELIEGRDPVGLGALEPAARAAVEQALERGRASRLFPRIVPKIGFRSLGTDLFE